MAEAGAGVREEIFDVVDAADRVIGQAPRGAVHRHGWRHRSVHVLLFDPQGRLYLQQRALSKDESPGLWDTSAAGHVGSGEGLAAAAARELFEELGVRSEAPLEFLFKLPASAATGHEFVSVYRAHSAATVRPEPGEIMAGRWLDKAALARALAAEPQAFTHTFRTIWETIRDA